jgi:hypothetical protein
MRSRKIEGCLILGAIDGLIRTCVEHQSNHLFVAADRGEVKWRFALRDDTWAHIGRRIQIGSGVHIRTGLKQSLDNTSIRLVIPSST